MKLFAVLADGVEQPLPLSAAVTDFDSLYEQLPGVAPGVYSVLRTFDGNKFLDLAGHIARLRQVKAVVDNRQGIFQVVGGGAHQLIFKVREPLKGQAILLAQPLLLLRLGLGLLRAMQHFQIPQPCQAFFIDCLFFEPVEPAIMDQSLLKVTAGFIDIGQLLVTRILFGLDARLFGQGQRLLNRGHCRFKLPLLAMQFSHIEQGIDLAKFAAGRLGQVE